MQASLSSCLLAIVIAKLTYFEHFLPSPLDDGLLMKKRKATRTFRNKFTVILNSYPP